MIFNPKAGTSTEELTFPFLSRKSKWFVFLACCLSILFLSSSAFAIDIPAEWGSVSKKSERPNARTLVLIQEAHVDYGAQKAIAEILKHLIEKESLGLILVEGGWGDMNLSYLRNYGSEEGRREVAERYLKNGLISGEEYLQIVGNADFSIWGVENEALYAKNMEAFLYIYEKQETWLSELSKLEVEMNQLAEKILPLPLQAFDQKRRAFDKHEISLMDYLVSLRELGIEQISLEPFPRLRALLDVVGAKEGIDPEKANWEKQALIRALSRKLTRPEFERIELLEKRSTVEEEISLLKTLVQYHKKYARSLSGISISNLEPYVRALEETTKADSGKMFEELASLEETAVDRLLVTQDQKDWVRIHRALRILRKLFELEMNTNDFETMEQNPGDFNLNTWKNFLAKKSTEFLNQPLPQLNWDEIEKGIPEAKAFYLFAKKREHALIENTVEKMESGNHHLAALIVGGYHAEELAQELNRQGFSIVIVSPRFTVNDPTAHQRRYFEILKSKWNSESRPNLNLYQGGLPTHVPKK